MSQKNIKNAPGAGKGAPKGKKGAAAGKKVEDEREETLQAVVRISIRNLVLQPQEMLNLAQVLADSFETRFNPFTLETPRVSGVIDVAESED
jgi:translation initiation factor eIF-2B subunit epsilon